MQTRKWAVLFSAMVAVALVVAACGGAAPTPQAPTGAMDSNESDEMVQAEVMDDVSNDTMDKDSDGEMKDEESEDLMDDNSDDVMNQESDDRIGQNSDDDMVDDDSDGVMNEESDELTGENSDDDTKDDGSDDMTSDGSMTMPDLPAWYSAGLTDVSSGEPFSIAELQGKVILVETMAIWCSNCLRQQQEVKALHETLGDRDDLVTVVLDIDLNEDAEKLRAYAAQHGFNWTYAVAPPEVAREISQLYGAQFLNPPSTPMLIIDRHGEAHLLPFGRKTAADLQEALAPFLDQDL